MTRNYALTVAYDGTRYSGWERKPGRATIQGKLEDVLSRFTGQPVKVIGAGRTDAGVHALAMTANVHLETALSPDALRRELNRYLPADIAVTALRPASDRFHARYNAAGKTYRYTCYCGDGKPVFTRSYVYCLNEAPNVTEMRRAAAYLTGQHDFRSFCGNPRMKKSTVRTVDVISVEQAGDTLTFTFHGDGFLQHMVRILVGTLLEVGWGKRSPETMPELLAARCRAEAGFTAPAQGLCLVQVEYQ